MIYEKKIMEILSLTKQQVFKEEKENNESRQTRLG